MVAGVINFSAGVSKVREPRRVTIQPSLKARLAGYSREKLSLVVGNFQQRCVALREKFKPTHDVLRPTFISVSVAKFRSIGEAECGPGALRTFFLVEDGAAALTSARPLR